MQGFILTRHWRDTSSGIQLELWLATDNGPVQLLIPGQSAVCFIREHDLSTVQSLLAGYAFVTYKTVELRNYHGESVVALYCQQRSQLQIVCEHLYKHNISLWEGDIKPIERFLMERFITATVDCPDTPAIATQSTFLTVQSSSVRPCAYQPVLSAVSLDIETSLDGKMLYSIAVYNLDHSVVFMVDTASEYSAQPNNWDEKIRIVWCSSENMCLRYFIDWINQIDPDVIIGWHVVQFDLWVLQQLCQKHRINFAIGRAQKTTHWREDNRQAQRRYITIPGRVVLDGIELLRIAFYQFERFSLQHVAEQLLGDSKLIEHDDRAGAITELFLKDKLQLARYNLHDCQLVWAIFEKTNLLEFAIARSILTGLPMDKMGGSVASFEYAYLPKLHRSGYVAPNLGELQSDITSPGGYVMQSQPGLYQHVLVLDFKSLYPSIIRTFNIDPFAFWYALHNSLDDQSVIPGFNGASFSRSHAILPDIIAALWQAREQAKLECNQPLSHAIKIIMNSFYGVLGSTGCRFYDPRVCSSITLRGHDIIQRSRDWILQQGYQVIYGDTDSLFIWLGDDVDDKQALSIGNELACQLNTWWKAILNDEMSITSRLEIEFETHYKVFLMPTIRGSKQGSKKRYAGLIKSEHNGKVSERLVFKGLEAVRADWTQLAKTFQQELYRRVFNKETYRTYICQIVNQLLQGRLDPQLVYHKKLRRSLHEYEKTSPPHVKAARYLLSVTGKTLKRGDSIYYVLTVNGPEAIDCQQSRIDYQHYMDKQLKPIVDSILVFVEDCFDDIVNQQMILL